MTRTLEIADRVKETSTTTGTGTYTLAGAVAGFDAFDNCFNDGVDVPCVVEDGNGGYEVGLFTFTSPNQLARTDITASSNGGVAVSWAAGTRTIFCAPTAQQFPPGSLIPLFERMVVHTLDTIDEVPVEMPRDDYCTRFTTLSDGCLVDVLVKAVSAGAADAKAWRLQALFAGGDVVGTVSKTVIAATAGASSWDVDLIPSGGGPEVAVLVTGAAATAIGWCATAVAAN